MTPWEYAFWLPLAGLLFTITYAIGRQDDEVSEVCAYIVLYSAWLWVPLMGLGLFLGVLA